jgi:putative transposase
MGQAGDGLIQQSYRYVLAPTPEQQKTLRSYTGASRFAFNWGLGLVKERLDQRAGGAQVRVPWSYYALCSEWAPVKDDIAPWRREVVVGSFLAGFEQLGAALQRFSEGRRKGRKVGFPRFKTKGNCRERVIFQYLTPADGRHVRIPKLGLVRSRESFRKLNRRLERDPKARVLRAALYELRPGRWLISFTVERSLKQRRPRKPRSVVGVDLGVRQLATLSYGRPVANPRPLESALRRLARAQRTLDRQRRANNPGNFLADGRVRPGPKQWHTSARMQRTRERLIRLHARVASLRRSQAHLLTRRLTDEHGVIGVESLNVAGMLRDRSVARSISDAGWGEILTQLRYKTAWAGSRLVSAGRFYPSSKRCSACGSVKAKLDRSATRFTCDACGFVRDRDENAARNLAQIAFERAIEEGIDHPYLARVGRERLNAREGRVRPTVRGWQCPSKREGSTPEGTESPQAREGLASTFG